MKAGCLYWSRPDLVLKKKSHGASKRRGKNTDVPQSLSLKKYASRWTDLAIQLLEKCHGSSKRQGEDTGALQLLWLKKCASGWTDLGIRDSIKRWGVEWKWKRRKKNGNAGGDEMFVENCCTCLTNSDRHVHLENVHLELPRTEHNFQDIEEAEATSTLRRIPRWNFRIPVYQGHGVRHLNGSASYS